MFKRPSKKQRNVALQTRMRELELPINGAWSRNFNNNDEKDCENKTGYVMLNPHRDVVLRKHDIL